MTAAIASAASPAPETPAGQPPVAGHRVGRRVITPGRLIDGPWSDMAVKLYAWYAFRDIGPNGCYENISAIARRFGVSRSTVHRAQAELLAGRWIYPAGDKGGHKVRPVAPDDTYALVPVTAIADPGPVDLNAIAPAAPAAAGNADDADADDTPPPPPPVDGARALRAYAYVLRANALAEICRRDHDQPCRRRCGKVTVDGLAAALRNKGTSKGNDRAAARPCSPATARRVLVSLTRDGWLTATTRQGAATVYQAQFAPIHNPSQPCDTPNEVSEGDPSQLCDSDPSQLCEKTPANGATRNHPHLRRGFFEQINHLGQERNGEVVAGERADDLHREGILAEVSPQRATAMVEIRAALERGRATMQAKRTARAERLDELRRRVGLPDPRTEPAADPPAAPTDAVDEGGPP
jgi:hypothetical protein